MTLSINNALDLITIESVLLDNFIANPASYETIIISIYHNNIVSPVSETYDSLTPIAEDTNVATNADVETISPAFLTVSTFTQGVYKIKIALRSSTQIQTDEGCLYIEDGLKCLIDDVLVDEIKSMAERVLTGLKYNMLLEVANCDCKCDKYIELYNNLITLTSGSKCQSC